jgi:peptide/nickel transport system permease protein
MSAVGGIAGSRPRPRRRRAWLRRHLGLAAGGVIVGGLVLCAILAPLLAPFDPDYQHADGLTAFGEPLPPGSDQFLLGTDQFGRDELSRLIYGSRVALLIAVVPNALALALALVVGVVAGYAGGHTDLVLMRITETVMTLPTFLLVMALLAVLGSSLGVVVLGIALISWTYFARVVHGEVARVRRSPFIEAARSLGAGTPRIVVRHVIPQLSPLLAIWASLNAAFMVLTEAGLGFLGFGVQPPTPTWGSMIGESQDYYLTSPWLALLPGACLALLVCGLYLVGDGLARQFGRPLGRVRL